MRTSPVRWLPAVLLVVVLALLPLQAWLAIGDDAVVVRGGSEGLREVTWVGTVAPDGNVSVRITYDLGDDVPRVLDVRVPDGARFLAVDGEPVAADIGRYATVDVQRIAVVTYEVPGRVTRYPDGVLVSFAAVRDDYLDGDQALFPCPRCYLEPVEYGRSAVAGALHHAGTGDVDVWLSDLDTFRTTQDPGLVRWIGVGDGSDVSMVAVLPADSAPGAPMGDGSVADEVEALRDAVRAADETLAAPAGGDGGGVVTALVLTAMFAALCAWIVWRLRRASAERVALAEPRPEPSGLAAVLDRTSDLEPALAGFTVGEAGPGERSAVAGTLLELARRGVISIDGVDSRRFTLTVPAGARGATKIEEVVLDALRPQGQLTATATLTGPPLWGRDGPKIARSIGRVVAREAFRRRLARFTLSVLVLVPASVAMGIVAVIGSGGLSVLGWIAVVGGPVLALVAALLSGVSLTAKGRLERERWLAYADWVRTNSELEAVGAPGIATWGDVLPYAAAVGAAPVAAQSLSPRYGG